MAGNPDRDGLLLGSLTFQRDLWLGHGGMLGADGGLDHTDTERQEQHCYCVRRDRALHLYPSPILFMKGCSLTDGFMVT